MTSSELLGHPSSFAVGGGNRATLDRIALAIARGNGPDFFWFDVLSHDGSIDAEERRVLEEIPPHRAYRVSPPEVELQNAIGNMALWAVVQAGPSATELADFLRLPGEVQRIVAERDPASGSGTLVVSNADHAAHLYPADAGTFSPYIQLLNRRGMTLILTTGMTPRANAADFEVTLKVVPGVSGARLVRCEKGPTDGKFTPFHSGSETEVGSLIDSLEHGRKVS